MNKKRLNGKHHVLIVYLFTEQLGLDAGICYLFIRQSLSHSDSTSHSTYIYIYIYIRNLGSVSLKLGQHIGKHVFNARCSYFVYRLVDCSCVIIGAYRFLHCISDIQSVF